MTIYARLGRVEIGAGYPTRIMGVINLSPESFYKESVRITEREVIDAAEQMIKEGADFIDVGGRSTAPYHITTITTEEEIRRTKETIKILTTSFNIPVSIDTTRAEVAEQAVKAGAEIINDVYGFEDEKILDIIKEYNVSAIAGARIIDQREEESILDSTINALARSLEKASKKEIDKERIAIDPAIGFYGLREKYKEQDKTVFVREVRRGMKSSNVYWYARDFIILASLDKIAERLGRPIVVGVSRKSFLRIPTGRRTPEERLYASLAAESYAALKGADVIRTHNVKQTRDAVKIAEWIRETEEVIKMNNGV